MSNEIQTRISEMRLDIASRTGCSTTFARFVRMTLLINKKPIFFFFLERAISFQWILVSHKFYILYFKLNLWEKFHLGIWDYSIEICIISIDITAIYSRDILHEGKIN